MIEQLRYLRRFNRAFGVSDNSVPTGIVSYELLQLRYDLIIEEFNEYVEASQRGDIVAICKELCDLLYVVFGAVLLHGLQGVIIQSFLEVHRSNMSKLDKDGSVILADNGKVLKSSYYSPPDLFSILNVDLPDEGP